LQHNVSMKRVIPFFKKKFISPAIKFIHDSKSIGITLLACTFISLLLANSPVSSHYLGFINATIPGFDSHFLPHSLLHFINDGLMSIFFFLAGMEIKRELNNGELSDIKNAILPIGGAIGGMLFPALIFLLLNKGSIYKDGWGIPTATDIAFSIGVASLLGKKVPVALKIFLTALAIIDDLGAIAIIAFFYGSAIQLKYLMLAAVVSGIIYFINKRLAKFGWVQIVLGIVLWACMYNSGIHATVAGVLLAFLIPTHWLALLEKKLHLPVYFIIMPIFALANTAIILPHNTASLLTDQLSVGILFGLFIGKPLGITLVCMYLVKRGYAKLPANTTVYQLIGVGILAGIGFTMSIFIATLAFTDTALQNEAKIAVLATSILAMIVGYIWLNNCKAKHTLTATN